MSRRGACVLIAAALWGCAAPGGAATDSPRIVMGRSGAAATLGALAAALREADYILLGEVHDNAEHHRLQELLLEHVARSGSVALVMEPFDLGDQPALDVAAANGYADSLAAAAGLPARSWNWAHYRPLVEIALSSGLPVVAGNLSRASAREVAAKGFVALPRGEALALEAVWSEPLEADLAREIAVAHCGMLPAGLVPGMVRAQRARDAVMADRMLQRPRAVLIAGAGHARLDRGVPLYLRHRAPSAKVVSIGFVERREAGVPSPPLPYDYAWITAPAVRDDPCAGFVAPSR